MSTELYQPLNEAGKWFVAPSFYIGQQTRSVFDGEEKIADYLVSVTQGGLDGGAVLGTWGQLRAGYVMSRVYARVDTGSPVLTSTREGSLSQPGWRTTEKMLSAVASAT